MMDSTRAALRLSLAVGGLAFLVSGRGAPRETSPASEREVGAVASVESGSAVRLAKRALAPRDISLAFTVGRLNRREDHYEIALLPRLPRDTTVDIVGGGGVVLVKFDGTVRVLRRYQ